MDMGMGGNPFRDDPLGTNPFGNDPFSNNPFAATSPEDASSNDQFVSRTQESYDRLANTPDIFGDLFLPGPKLFIQDGGLNDAGIALPPAGGGRIKVAEFNKAITRDRVFVSYNHYHNAVNSSGELNGQPFQTSLDVDRFMVGLEKSFQDGLFSIEIRMPVASSLQFDQGGVTASSGSIGNLGAILKVLLFNANGWTGVAGTGVSTPTGGDITGQIGATSFRIHNEAVNLMPFAGVMHVRGPFFCHGFGQLDIPLDNNSLEVQGVPTTKLDDQTLMLLDVVAGVWLYRQPQQDFFSGLAASVECHYTHAFESFDEVGLTDGAVDVFFVTGDPRINFINLTTGLTLQVTRRAQLQVGYTMPLDQEGNRAFDSEVQAVISNSY